MARFLRLSALLAVALIFPATAFAGSLTLHPSGFGEKAYSAWKAKQGLPDSKGNDAQALYFQKMTSTATFSAGVAIIKGVAGLPANQLEGLAWDHRTDGHCGAGAPRWNVGLRDPVSGQNYTVFLGCYAAQHTQLTATGPSGHTWCRDTYPSPATDIAAQTGQPASALTIRYLAILFDEGTDTANPPPAGCDQTNFAGGYIHLDNITVQIDGVVHCWTSANDNGNASGPCPAPTSAVTSLDALSGAALPVGIGVDPTDVDLVDALTALYPDVPLVSWSLYPYSY